VSLADLHRYDFVSPDSLPEVCQLLAERAAKDERTVLLAGGTDFMVEVSQGGLAPDPLPLVVDVSRVPELGGIHFDGTTMRIGATVSYLEMQRHSAVRDYAPLIARTTHDIGGPTIQARGTLGGNLATASPAADGVAAIAAYDAVIEVASVGGTRKIPIAELQTGYKRSSRRPDEVIVAIELQPPPRGSAWCWRKVGTRLAQAISKVALAAVAVVEAGRTTRVGLAMASVAPITALLPKTRELVASTPVAELGRDAVDTAILADIAPIDDIRSTREYRLHCAKAVTREFLRELGAQL
jgi:CO/xanthine dehydrogenase FAD-binding subunit